MPGLHQAICARMAAMRAPLLERDVTDRANVSETRTNALNNLIIRAKDCPASREYAGTRYEQLSQLAPFLRAVDRQKLSDSIIDVMSISDRGLSLKWKVHGLMAIFSYFAEEH